MGPEQPLHDSLAKSRMANEEQVKAFLILRGIMG